MKYVRILTDTNHSDLQDSINRWIKGFSEEHKGSIQDIRIEMSWRGAGVFLIGYIIYQY